MPPEGPKIPRAQAEALTEKFLKDLAEKGWGLHVVYSTTKFFLERHPKKR